MHPFARILTCSAGLLWLVAAPVALADDEEDDSPQSRREAAKEEREAKAAARRAAREAKRKGEVDEKMEGVSKPIVTKGDFGKELTALNEAAGMLAEVKDEASAKEIVKKLIHTFSSLPPLLNGNEDDLEKLARAQNAVSRQMMRLKDLPYFESAGLQEAWTLMTDQFSRRSAERRRGR